MRESPQNPNLPSTQKLAPWDVLLWPSFWAAPKMRWQNRSSSTKWDKSKFGTLLKFPSKIKTYEKNAADQSRAGGCFYSWIFMQCNQTEMHKWISMYKTKSVRQSFQWMALSSMCRPNRSKVNGGIDTLAIYIYIYIHIHTYIYIHIHTYTHLYTPICIHV